MRLSGDDYCYGAVEREHGFWQTQSYAYLHETMFGGNRFSLNLVSSINTDVGPISGAIMPGLVLVFWLVGMTISTWELYLLSARDVQAKNRQMLIAICLMCGLVVFLSLYLAPNLEQSLYWRSALSTYILPLSFFIFTTAFFIHTIRTARQPWFSWIGLLVLSFFAAGFSETVTAVQLGLYCMILMAVLVQAGKQRSANRRILIPLSAVMAGTIAATAILLVSPANSGRLVGLPQPPGLVKLIQMSIQNAFVFYKISLYHQILPIILCGLFFVAMSSLFYLSQPPKNGYAEKLSFRWFFIISIACCVIGFLLVVAAMAPSAYAESSYPDLRVIIVPLWIMLIQVSSLGWLAGALISRWLKLKSRIEQYAKIAALFIIASVGILSVSAAINVYAQLPRFQRWAAYWDQRDSLIRQEALAGASVVHVMEIDKIITDLSELKPDPFFWYNVCAARYYGVERIYADLPGWDP